MDKQAFIKFCRQGNAFDARIPEQINPLLECSFEAQKITQKLNSEFHTQAEIVALFRELTDLPVDDSFIAFHRFTQILARTFISVKTCFSIQVVLFKIAVAFLSATAR